MQAVSPVVIALATLVACIPATGRVFPEPREIQFAGQPFRLDANVSILIPAHPSRSDSDLAGRMSGELSSRYGLAIRRESVVRLPTRGRFILLGAISNPLVKAYCASHQLTVDAGNPGPEGYRLSVTPEAVVVAGSDEAGAFYGFQSLRQLIEAGDSGLRLPGVQIRDWPYSRFRGVRIYAPGREHFAFFKRFVRDYLALYKYNKLVLEFNATMRLDRHPELNAGSLELARDLHSRRLNNTPGLWFHEPDSTHANVADGGILEKSEVAEVVRWAEENHLEIIPELPSLTHSAYLLTRHRELAEVPQEEWPDTYCPLLPAVYDLLFDVYDEYIAVIHPKMVHIGHDEWRMPWGVCPRCRAKDPRELYARDVVRIHDYLQRKGIRTAMWCDHLLENVRGARLSKPWWEAPGYDYQIPGALSPDQVKRWIPKDILMFNWLWNYSEDPKCPPVSNEERLSEWGFEQIYGNFEASIPDFRERMSRSKISGAAISGWTPVSEFTFGKDLLGDFTGCAEMLWSGRERTARERSALLNEMMPAIRRNLCGSDQPSRWDPPAPIDLSGQLNSGVPGFDPAAWRAGTVVRDGLTFALADPTAHGAKIVLIAGSKGEGETPYPPRPAAIPIGRDVTSLVFLHAALKPANSEVSYRRSYDFEDTSDLLGWYEVEYEDGLVTTVPVRYGWNILDLKNQSGAAAYQAVPVDCGGPSFYAFEWTNTRLGVTIKQVRLAGSTGFKNSDGKTIPSNAILLAAISAVPKREKARVPDPPFPK